MNILKQSTAATIKLGPFIDDTDGKTAETALSIAQADVRLSKNGGDFAKKNSTTSTTHDENGYYDISLNATDTGTLGRLRVAVSKSGALPVWQDFLVVTANVYDTLCSTDSLDVNVTSLADDVITAAKFDESTAFPLKSADTGSTQVARTGADGDTLETLSDEIAAVQADLDNPDQYKADVSGIPAAVWGYATRTLSSFGTLISDIWSHATRTLSAFGFTVATQSDANVTAIKAKTDNLPTTPANEATLTAIKGAGWTDETLVALMTAIENISAGSGASAQEVWEYATRTLTGLPALPTDWITAASLKADAVTEIQSGLALEATLQAIRGASGDTLETLSDEIATVQADLDNPDQYKADVSGIPAAVWGYATRTLSSFGTLISDIWSHATRTLSAFGFTVATQSDANVTAIKAKTDNLPATPANEATLTAISALVDDLESRLTAVRAGYLDKLNVTGTLANTDNASLFSDDLLNSIIEDTISLKESLRLMLAVLAGRSDGGGTGTIKFKDLGGTFDRITATVDVVGNRTNVVLDGSDTGV